MRIHRQHRQQRQQIPIPRSQLAVAKGLVTGTKFRFFDLRAYGRKLVGRPWPANVMDFVMRPYCPPTQPESQHGASVVYHCKLHADHSPEGYRRKLSRDIKRLHPDRRGLPGHRSFGIPHKTVIPRAA